ncbi:nicotinate-nucleotide--dimethylbenzimidazole phosphoribosyltransferase [Nocardiopsis sp. NPDC006198]|uniref:nicotinate-nucleotide--dimethylbenzimidazole phosphoribosyltransferase n=1 Tax=Nocardiopsis sp. NPDC006198 TaxID=3154472 RepID=UPI0033B137C0
MTNDDRGDARSGGDGEHEPPRWRSGKPAPGLGSRIGGLLDGLPESGRGTQARAPHAAGGPANPFRLREPAPPQPPPRPEAGEPVPQGPPPEEPGAEDPAEPQPGAPTEDVADRHTTAPREAPAASEPSPDMPPPSGPPLRPNVIPLRGERAAEPAATGPHDPAGPTTNHGHADQHPATTEPEQGMYAHEAAAPPPGPQHTGPSRPASDPARARSAPAPASAGTGEPRDPRAHPEPEGAGADPRPAPAFDDAERAAVYRALRGRHDARTRFRPDPVPHGVLTRVLEAAHQAPSVGHSQPWDFVVVQDPALRSRVRDLALAGREALADAPHGTRALDGAEVEAVLEAPVNIAVTVDPARGAHHVRGRHARPESASHAAALAVENLRIAARAEGLGVAWVGHVDAPDIARALELPSYLGVVAYLCVGLVEEPPAEPEPAPAGWADERPLSWAVHHDRYGHRGLPGQEPTSLLEETITAIGALDTRVLEEARDRQDRMTKPPGSLGVLEDISVQLAGLAGECPPPIPEPAAVAVFAGDHGVHAQGVTPWPQEVTAQMVHNFLEGGAVVNALARQVGAGVTVVDVGVVGDLPGAAGLLPRKVARGTADFTRGPAMTREQALQALEGGIEVARDLVSAGNRCLVTGDMGIANTTPAAALVCAFTGADPARATGRGTGVDDATFEHKVDVVRRALAANPVDPADPIGTLAALGGLEHAALAGFVLGGAALRVPVLLDGVIAGSAALAAAAISPEALGACFAGHRSSEPGHSLALDHLGLRPLVDLELRLGEGSGALLALPLLQGAARVLRDVATFDDAGVSTAHA